jgi:hypothetical protein
MQWKRRHRRHHRGLGFAVIAAAAISPELPFTSW